MMPRFFTSDGAEQVRVSYYKRYRMEIDLETLPAPQLSPDFAWVPWGYDLIDAHAEALYESFHQEIDAAVFPSLGDRVGCVHLIAEICRKLGFLPGATWLLCHGQLAACATV